MCLLQWGSHSRCACCSGGPILDVLAAMEVPFCSCIFDEGTYHGLVLCRRASQFQLWQLPDVFLKNKVRTVKAKHPVCLAIDVVNELFLPKVTLQCHPKVTC